MNFRRSGVGGGRRPPPARGTRSSGYYEEQEESPPARSDRTGDSRRARLVPRGARGGRPSRTQREPFLASGRERRAAGPAEGSSALIRQIYLADPESVVWLQSEEAVPILVGRVVRVVESIEERLKIESYNGYSGNVWEADDPISNSVKEKYQELQLRLNELISLLQQPSDRIVEELAEGFYLLFSVMHVLLLNRDIPAFCEHRIAQVMAAGAVIGMDHGQPHVVLSCTTDHLRDSETDSILLAFQHVLFEIINNDVDGQKLFGTAHRVLDAQMDILETRDDEDTAISAINIVGVISVRHPQAFKTRFWDLMDLFFGWYIDALPADRVFDTCVSAFGLFREKFKQEIDWALKMSRQFTEDMEGAVKSLKNVGVDRTGADHHQSTFLALLQLFSLIYHAICDRIRGTARAPADSGTRQIVKNSMTSILKALNQILQVSDPGFLQLSEQVNRALLITISAIGNECIPISNLLFLYARMQQTSAFHVHSVLQLQVAYVNSLFGLVASILRATGDHFPKDAAKDLLGPGSILFTASRFKCYGPSVRNLFEALFSSCTPSIKDYVLKSFAQEYRRAVSTLANGRSGGATLMEAYSSNERIKLHPVRKFLGSSIFSKDGGVPSDSLAILKTMCESGEVFLTTEGMEDAPLPSDVRGVLNVETIGQVCRDKISSYLLIVQLSLILEQPFDQEFVDGCYKMLIKDMDAAWIVDFPDLVVAHVHLAKAMWQKLV